MIMKVTLGLADILGSGNKKTLLDLADTLLSLTTTKRTVPSCPNDLTLHVNSPFSGPESSVRLRGAREHRATAGTGPARSSRPRGQAFRRATETRVLKVPKACVSFNVRIPAYA